MADDKDRDRPAARLVEDSAEGPHGRIDDPNTPPEEGAIERGRVDAGPSGDREGGFREPESGNRIMMIAGAAVAVIILVVLIGWVF